MKIVITGITGFIGLNYLKCLNPEYEYTCLVRKSSNTDILQAYPQVSVKKIDFSCSEIEQEIHGKDILIHMAGQMGGYGIPVETFERVNCQLTQDIVKACRATGIRQFIYLSTPGVQGFGHRLCTENTSYAPRNKYEETKVRAEEIIINTLKNSAVKYTIIRPDFVYGPGDYRRIKMYKNIRDRKFILTTSGKSYLHPTYVMDVVQGINKSLAAPNAYNEIFNISAENDITVQEYLKVMTSYFNVTLLKINVGYHLSIFFADIIEKFCNYLLKREGFVSKNKIDFLALDHSTSNKKARELLGYKPEYTFERGFELTMKWCKKNNLL